MKEETRKKISLAKLGQRSSPRTEFKKGQIPWNKGLTKDTDIRMKIVSDKLMGNECAKDRILTDIHKKRLSNSLKGRIHSEEIRKKISKTLTGKMVGEKHPHWKGGITHFKIKIRGLPKYRQWVKKIFRRDNWICQKCGQKGYHLNAHHIISFIEILSNYKIQTIKDAQNCEQLWDINNGLTLCKFCHLEKK